MAWCSDVGRLGEFGMTAAAFLEKPPTGLLADPESREAPPSSAPMKTFPLTMA